MLLYITIVYNMFRALFEFFNTNILSVCYDIKTNSLYERENEITLNKYKKNDDIKTKTNKNNNDINNDNDNINIYDNINILFKNYYDNRDENVKENYNINNNDNHNHNNDNHNNDNDNDNDNHNNDINTDTDTDIYDIISNEEIKEGTF